MTDRRAEEDEQSRQTAIALGTLVAGYGAHRAVLAAEASGYGALRALSTGGRVLLRAAGWIGLLSMLYDPNTPSRNQFRKALGDYVRSELRLMRNELTGLNLTGGTEGFVRYLSHGLDHNGNFGAFLTQLQRTEEGLRGLSDRGDVQARQVLEVMHRHIGRILPNLVNLGSDNLQVPENPPSRTVADLLGTVRPMLWNPDTVGKHEPASGGPQQPRPGPSLTP
jgi:hypothetical protein